MDARFYLTKYIHVEAAAFDDVFERANRDWFAAVIGNDDLPPVRMSPFLMTATLAHEDESVLLQDLRDFSRAANRKAPAHGSASSSTLAPCGNGTSAGSNHRANASFAFATASSSVSPALAHPGSSGKTADQRCTSGSNSMTRRSFTTLEDSGVRPDSHSNNLCPPISGFCPPTSER
jgi:hypothetical protein